MTIASFLQPDQAGPQQDALNELIESSQLVIWPNPSKQNFGSHQGLGRNDIHDADQIVGEDCECRL
jgi:hypothetical protein